MLVVGIGAPLAHCHEDLPDARRAEALQMRLHLALVRDALVEDHDVYEPESPVRAGMRPFQVARVWDDRRRPCYHAPRVLDEALRSGGSHFDTKKVQVLCF